MVELAYWIMPKMVKRKYSQKMDMLCRNQGCTSPQNDCFLLIPTLNSRELAWQMFSDSTEVVKSIAVSLSAYLELKFQPHFWKFEYTRFL